MVSRTGQPGSVQVEIEQANSEFSREFATADAGAVAAMYTDTAKVFPPHAALVEGLPAIEQFWKRAMRSIKNVTLQTLEVESFEDTAIEDGAATLFGPDGSVVDHGKYLVVWKRVSGKWRLHRDCWNSNDPLPPH